MAADAFIPALSQQDALIRAWILGKIMNKGILTGVAATAFAATLALAAPATAAVTFNQATGEGFVGKGDVQLAFGWNNSQLQSRATDVKFAAASETVTEVSWVCTNPRNENTQERERTTTTSTSGVVSAVTRDNKTRQVTGFNLSGYAGDPTQTSTTEGNQLNSCPTNWTLTTPAGDPVVVSQTSELTATYGTVTVILAQF
ncbi:hypothetical protein ACFQ36_12785 [Arthrobacter sp. GCM10027362]|uniref:hypothetical protein n=1 Tax=Arthrobacter sp. GCM10027362 TaxID=3273379 RepID=UPI003641C400